MSDHPTTPTTRPAAAPPPPSRAAPRPQRKGVRRRTLLRRIDPWSVLKLSLIFYFCLLIVAMLGLGVFWVTVDRLGVISTMLGFLEELQFNVEVNPGNLFRAAFLTGLLNVILWSGVNVFAALLYNLVADVIGGLRITLVDEE